MPKQTKRGGLPSESGGRPKGASLVMSTDLLRKLKPGQCVIERFGEREAFRYSVSHTGLVYVDELVVAFSKVRWVNTEYTFHQPR